MILLIALIRHGYAVPPSPKGRQSAAVKNLTVYCAAPRSWDSSRCSE